MVQRPMLAPGARIQPQRGNVWLAWAGWCRGWERMMGGQTDMERRCFWIRRWRIRHGKVRILIWILTPIPNITCCSDLHQWNCWHRHEQPHGVTETHYSVRVKIFDLQPPPSVRLSDLQMQAGEPLKLNWITSKAVRFGFGGAIHLPWSTVKAVIEKLRSPRPHGDLCFPWRKSWIHGGVLISCLLQGKSPHWRGRSWLDWSPCRSV